MFLTEKRKLLPLSLLQCHVIALCDLEFMNHISLFFLLFCLRIHHPCVKKIPWRRKWLSSTISQPGEFHGLRSMASYSPWGLTQSDLTKQLTHTHTHTHTHTQSINTHTVHHHFNSRNKCNCNAWKWNFESFPDSFRMRTKATTIWANMFWQNIPAGNISKNQYIILKMIR